MKKQAYCEADLNITNEYLHMSPLVTWHRLVIPATPESGHHTSPLPPSSSRGGPRHQTVSKSLSCENERGREQRVTEGQRERLGTSGYRLLDVQRARRAGSLSYVLSTSNLGGWTQPEGIP